MNKSESGNVPQTIDSAGNIVPKPNGVSRWATPRKTPCWHEDCPEIAFIFQWRAAKAHNCCGSHDEGDY